jgi:hypothetical protein
MNGTKLNTLVYKGYAKAATKIGTPYQHYRPLSATNPLASGNRLADMPVSLNANDPQYSRPNMYGKATWYAVADGSQLQVGDYIVGIEGTLFVAALQQLLPIYMVDCNRTISILRPQIGLSVGALPYSGDTQGNEVMLMQSWPASVLQGSKGEKNETNLPGDVKTPWWAVLVPYFPGVTLQTSDVIVDDLGRRMIISGAELTDLGWRMTCMQATV